MIVSWHRQGLFIFPVPFIGFILAKIACDEWFGQAYFKYELAPKVGCGLAAAVATGLVGLLMNRGLPPERKHRLYWLPVEWWCIPVILVTALCAMAAR